MSDEIFRSAKRRVFVSAPLEGSPERYDLDDESSHYLTRVLRLREGTAVDLADGTGRLFQGALTKSGDGWALASLALIHQEPARPLRVLAASLIKFDRFEWMIEKAAELGADLVIPIEAERSVVAVEPRKVDARVGRWQKIAEGAARQCERLGAVRVLAPQSLEDTLAAFPEAQRLMLDEVVAMRPWPSIREGAPLVLFIGPEGGWSDDERSQLEAAGVERCGLGPNLLRAECAALAALTLVRALDAGLVR